MVVHITIKTDQEPGIMSLTKAIAVRRKAPTATIDSPVRESQSNSEVERAIRTWRGQFRVLRVQLEENIGTKVPITHPLIGWMVIWAGELIMKFAVKENGRTGYENITRHKCNHPLVMFGETMYFKVASLKTGGDKSNSDWQTGIFVGVEPSST